MSEKRIRLHFSTYLSENEGLAHFTGTCVVVQGPLSNRVLGPFSYYNCAYLMACLWHISTDSHVVVFLVIVGQWFKLL